MACAEAMTRTCDILSKAQWLNHHCHQCHNDVHIRSILIIKALGAALAAEHLHTLRADSTEKYDAQLLRPRSQAWPKASQLKRNNANRKSHGRHSCLKAKDKI